MASGLGPARPTLGLLKGGTLPCTCLVTQIARDRPGPGLQRGSSPLAPSWLKTSIDASNARGSPPREKGRKPQR
eukprot:155027-Lingulodinium_polyedra.AAC.1